MENLRRAGRPLKYMKENTPVFASLTIAFSSDEVIR